MVVAEVFNSLPADQPSIGYLTIEEDLQMTATSFQELRALWSWRTIPNCPGRFVLVNDDKHIPLAALVSRSESAASHEVEGLNDRVIVLPVTGGGLISYARNDGTMLHTLNSPDGFARKLKQLGIPC